MSSTDFTLSGATVSPTRATPFGDTLDCSNRTTAKVIGALFLLGFLVYGIGSGLVQSVVGGSEFLSTVTAHRNTLVLGALLMLLNVAVEMGKGVLFFPILDRYSRKTALAYLATMIVEATVLAVGVLCLLMIVPLAKQSVDAGPVSASWAQDLGSLAVKSNTMAYQVAELALGVGGIFLCLLLFQTRLIPRFLSVLGLVGYPILMAGAIAEIFGIHVGLVLSIPGGLFEVVLAIWLLSKGFQPERGVNRVPITLALSLGRP
jgi:hypothetical protein